MNALQRLSITEQDALLMRVAAEGLDISQLACHMTRQQASGRGRHPDTGGFLGGRAFNISYNLMLCEHCGNLMPQRVCPWKAEQLKQRLLGE
jgi:Fe-S-cluster-containing dehydrogenase component